MDTIEQVVLVKDINPNFVNVYDGSSFPAGSYPVSLTEFNDRLYFSALNLTTSYTLLLMMVRVTENYSLRTVRQKGLS